MTAARTGNVDVVNLLMAAGADVNAHESWENETALMWAAGEDHADVVATLAAHGADVNARSKLFDYPKVKVDIATMAVTAVPKGNLTALLFAARQGAAHAASALIAAGADLNAADPDGTTPVLLAIINAHYDVATVLVDAGADLTRADNAGMGPLYAAVDMLHQEPLLNRPFRQPTGDVRPLDLIRLLLDRGADPNARLKSPLLIRQHNGGDPLLGDGATPLMRAAKVSDVGLMRLLLDKGADSKRTTKNGTTALMIAASRPGRPGPPEEQTIAALELLRQHGADPNAVNANGETALHLAVGRGDQVVSYLVEHGASLDIKDVFGRTPLDVALGVPGGGRGRGAAAAEKPPVYEATAALLRKFGAARTP
jgi:ankyrin repeat protein